MAELKELSSATRTRLIQAAAEIVRDNGAAILNGHYPLLQGAEKKRIPGDLLGETFRALLTSMAASLPSEQR